MWETVSPFELVDYLDPILKEHIPEFDFRNPSIEPQKFALALSRTMIEQDGMGLAANQVGHRVRAFAIHTNPIIVMFNPYIIDFSSEVVTLEEGCLSYPGLIVKVARPKSIKVRFTYPDGKGDTKTYTGITARIIQHELEHLNGGRFFEGVEWYEKEKAKRWFKSKHRGRKHKQKP